VARYSFFQLDVFTKTPLHGNPLAVFPHAAGLDTQTMQALAREMNLSETTFVTDSERATRRVRFFTPAAEIPLAGHPTIGTWRLLAEQGELELGDSQTVRVTQETGAGILPVEIDMTNGNPGTVTMTQTLPKFGPTVDDIHGLASELGAEPDALGSTPPPQIVSTALPQLMVPVRSLGDVAALPSGGTGGRLGEVLRELGTECAMCFALETENPESTVHCRMFAPGLGVPEDPATGSAAGALGAYLVTYGLVPLVDGRARVVVEQGLEIGRPSSILVDVETEPTGDISAVRVGGEAVTIISGDVTL
jgi:trans-2,3-dihydro-3-hydroxyanthranilate isomerase